MYERFIARQPILDTTLNLYRYALLFRARDDNRAGVHPDATGQLIASSAMLFDRDCATRRLDLKEVLLPGCYMKATERAAVIA